MNISSKSNFLMHVYYAVNISLITATEDLLQNIWQENGLMSVSSIYSNARTYVSVFFHYLGLYKKK
ncbi:hypothetical protein PANT111_40184 [Pantoea brenneri]|uniref:Uncharacterized protein n=1 Tax=Pantoea brenneri TaxID=472694 RepID=A0AAX3JAL7_9GAMM|nr:hypothetical protein PANT111_40184 [Pantoea brenneri]